MFRDTVASVGLVPKYLPFVGSNSCIRWFRHAIALDEHRVKFLPSYWKSSHDYEDEEEEKRAQSAMDALQKLLGLEKEETVAKDTVTKRLKGHSRNQHSEVWKFENEINRATGMKTDAQEVWFAGVHTGMCLVYARNRSGLIYSFP